MIEIINVFQVTISDIRKFEEQYRFSAEEDEDLKKAYSDGNGNMNFILDNVLCCTVEDDERFEKKIEGWLADGSLPKLPELKKTMTKAAKTKRRGKSSKEAAEADQHAADLGLTTPANGDESLRMMIMQRQEKRAQESDNFLDALAAKYAKPDKKAKAKGKKQ